METWKITLRSRSNASNGQKEITATYMGDLERRTGSKLNWKFVGFGRKETVEIIVTDLHSMGVVLANLSAHLIAVDKIG